ncbi:TonB-dependent receptor [Silanimonas sp.]|uniref:TonB-dependent receptor n=1 Tax=Silanimonas sp. TaxID=1929290 RepID=UPI001BC7FEDE|nr:TonB-dependent receptor [Silanimonas sp.]MBS3896520.1 TonB-dependent receptor [Silanimonas sp.]MBS3924130.1 TonB-dependent receptor [Xanthomonadaceae bacterium]
MRRPVPLAVAIHAALVLAVLPAAAQTAAAPAASAEAAVIDTIIVTAQKREQQVQEVPIAISAYSGEFLESFGATSLDDIGNLVPGLEIQEQSPNNPGFVIRGITSDSGQAFAPPRVSVFQDGVPISRARGAVVQPFDLERIEVLRGPQGTLFGRGAQVGAVHLVQRKARQDHESRFTVGLGSDEWRRLSGVVNAPLSEVLAMRLAVHHEYHRGFVENRAGGRLNGKDTTAARLSFGLDLGEDQRIDVILNHQVDTPPGTAFRTNVLPTRGGSRNVFDFTADLNRGEQLGLDRSVNSLTVLGEFRLTEAWSLSTVSGWREFDSLEQFDADGSQLNALEFAEDAEGSQFSQEFRFNYDAGGAFRGFAGASWFHEEGSQRVPFSTDERQLAALLSPALRGGVAAATRGLILLSVVSPLNPDLTPFLGYTSFPALGIPSIPLGTPLPLRATHREETTNFGETKAWDLFADGTWSLSDRFDLTLGLRGTREDLRSGYEALSFAGFSPLGQVLPSAPTNVAIPNILFRPVARRFAEDSFSSVVGRAVAAYRFSERMNGYASISRGRRPDLIEFPLGSDGTPNLIPAEIVISYELGLKGSLLDDVLVYDIAVFNYDYSNFQASVLNPAGVGTITADGGNASASGAEISLIVRASEQLQGFFTYGHIDASFDERDDQGRRQTLAGNRFRLTPEHSASAGLDWRFEVGGGMEAFLRPSWNWRSQVFFEDQNQPGIEQAGFALVDLRAGLRLDEGRWELGAFVRNLGDREYLIDAGNTGLNFGLPTFIVGAPRTWGLELSGRF